MPWAPTSRQVEGRKSEKRVLKARGAKVHPMSGAGRIKQDGSDSECIYEVKDANKQFVLKEREVHDAWLNAVRNGKSSVWLVLFPNYEVEMHVRKRSE